MDIETRPDFIIKKYKGRPVLSFIDKTHNKMKTMNIFGSKYNLEQELRQTGLTLNKIIRILNDPYVYNGKEFNNVVDFYFENIEMFNNMLRSASNDKTFFTMKKRIDVKNLLKTYISNLDFRRGLSEIARYPDGYITPPEPDAQEDWIDEDEARVLNEPRVLNDARVLREARVLDKARVLNEDEIIGGRIKSRRRRRRSSKRKLTKKKRVKRRN